MSEKMILEFKEINKSFSGVCSLIGCAADGTACPGFHRTDTLKNHEIEKVLSKCSSVNGISIATVTGVCVSFSLKYR